METTYKIIGGDGHEYGPVMLEELKSWVRDGRIGRHTHIWRSDVGTWLAAAQYQELRGEIGSLPLSATGAATGFDGVGFWARLGAFIVDSLLLYLIYAAVAMLLGWPLNIKFASGTPPASFEDLKPLLFDMGRQISLSFFLRLIYEVMMTGALGATLGKMIIGAKIVRADGSKLGYGFALLRFLAKIISDVACYVGYLFIAFREDKRALHDLIVGTRVIYKR